jgi:hypothetical protein
MSSDSDASEFERRINNRIDTIVENQAQFSEDMLMLKELQKQQAENISRHSEQIKQLTENILAVQTQVDSLITEMRDGFDKLILANEVTRDLAEKATRLAIQTSQRVTLLEEKPS